MNTTLIRRVFEIVRAEAKRVDDSRWNQQYWSLLTSDTSLDEYRLATYDIRPSFAPERVDSLKARPVPSCKTAMCFAGWTVAMDDPEALMLVDSSGTADYALLSDGAVVNICDHAREVLGLTRDQSDELFSGGNDLAAISSVLIEDFGISLRSGRDE